MSTWDPDKWFRLWFVPVDTRLYRRTNCGTCRIRVARGISWFCSWSMDQIHGLHFQTLEPKTSEMKMLWMFFFSDENGIYGKFHKILTQNRWKDQNQHFQKICGMFQVHFWDFWKSPWIFFTNCNCTTWKIDISPGVFIFSAAAPHLRISMCNLPLFWFFFYHFFACCFGILSLSKHVWTGNEWR